MCWKSDRSGRIARRLLLKEMKALPCLTSSHSSQLRPRQQVQCRAIKSFSKFFLKRRHFASTALATRNSSRTLSQLLSIPPRLCPRPRWALFPFRLYSIWFNFNLFLIRDVLPDERFVQLVRQLELVKDDDRLLIEGQVKRKRGRSDLDNDNQNVFSVFY